MRREEYPGNSGMASADDPADCQPSATERPAGSITDRFSPALKREGRLLLQLGIGKPAIASAMLRAHQNSTTAESELLAAGGVHENTYYEAIAERFGLDFMPEIDVAHVQDIAGLDSQISRPETLRLHHPTRAPITVIVPALSRFDYLTDLLTRRPGLHRSLAVSTPSKVRQAAWQAGRFRRVSATTRMLFETAPLYSAQITFWGKQGFYAGIVLCALFAMAITLPFASLLLLHIVLTLFYLANFLVRFYALGRSLRHAKSLRSSALIACDAPLPVYSILVALYKEADVAPQLVGALDRIDWPRSRLDIKLICEDDDRETIDALRALPLGPEYDIVEVPFHLPRTKPKALAYALPGVRGTFVTVYDAEDRPHPLQLREAWATFTAAPQDIMCLQAPLIVTNAHRSWLSALFALEYAGLFRGLLPMLSLSGLPLPLGGTSNHFRTAQLRLAGGWDPYNMTEDADLGLRLHRLGYRARTISKPTFEDAPTTLAVWLGQRTRWFKGWLQTWLVLMRRPAMLRREIGWLAFGVFQILIAGMLLSSLCHPVVIGFLAYLTYELLQHGRLADDWFAFWLLVCDIVNIFGAYAVFIALGQNGMGSRERKAVGRQWAFVPLYWIVMSLAAWRAVLELKTDPFSWNKTPHQPVVAEPTGDANR